MTYQVTALGEHGFSRLRAMRQARIASKNRGNYAWVTLEQKDGKTNYLAWYCDYQEPMGQAGITGGVVAEYSDGVRL